MLEMAENPNKVAGDPEWCQLFNDRLRERGIEKKELAEQLGVHPSMVTRMGNGGSVSSGQLYRASVLLGIRPPTTLPLDDMQQRMLSALVQAREVLRPEHADALVRGFEAQVDKAVDAYRQFLGAMGDLVGPNGEMPGGELQGEARTAVERVEALTGLPARDRFPLNLEPLARREHAKRRPADEEPNEPE